MRRLCISDGGAGGRPRRTAAAAAGRHRPLRRLLPLAGGLVLLSFLLILARIDARTQLLPDRLTLPLLWAGLLFNLNEVYIA
ncbi:A24 family peptidase, partial [Mycobacterium tuberculosis]|nr:A24 family peptidase [Mycobacterium tuberculosis]